MNPVRVQFIRQKLLECSYDDESIPDGVSSAKMLNPLTGLHVLDVGCGGGLLSESLARLGARTLGIDASRSNIAIAQSHASADPKLSSTLSYLHSPAEPLLSEPKRYDVVCSMEVIEHVNDPAKFLETCAELVKPGGHLFLSTISRTPLSYLLTILLAEHVLRLVSSGTHTYSKYVKPSELIDFFKQYRSPLEQQGEQQLSRPWINPNIPRPTRTEAEVRGLLYNPLQARWILAPRDALGSTECNYLFWVRKPKL
ncbi:hypothetical protein M378DRAFT_98583 [Amanita muscaria Koide BX008]|uniref:3-demethylubiquinol 3-O-methyltransferase n=1 Tax=Amanita muscaria (strain Koide BX008) TaxID=946122 RepID=A0A0C2TPT1_AMAMK|nr:hypothetical protein M378DRAFT_98583 [Amanita muscaria Koide BX008]